MEIRIESVNKDNSHPVRISHDLKTLVTDSIDKEYDDNEQDNEQETSTTKTEVFVFASRSKAKAKPRRFSTTYLQGLFIFLKENGLILNEELNSIMRTQWQKRINTLIQHGEPREEDDADEFWRLKDNLRNKVECSQHWSCDVWKSKMAGDEDNEKKFNADPSGEILYLRALQDHSGRNPIHPALQDNVLIPNDFFECIYHVGCAVSVHSIKNSELIARGQNSSRERHTVFFTSVNPMQ